MHGSRKFCQRGPNFDNRFFSLMRGGRIKIPLLASHQRPASETPLYWLGCLVIFCQILMICVTFRANVYLFRNHKLGRALDSFRDSILRISQKTCLSKINILYGQSHDPRIVRLN